MWWVGRCIRNERENCCDDLAVQICGNPATYVRALTDLEQLRGTTPEFAMAADGGSLLRRVERLLDLNSHLNSTPSGLLAIVGIAIVCVSVIGVEARGFTRAQQTNLQTNLPRSSKALIAEASSPAAPLPAAAGPGLLAETSQAAQAQPAPTRQETASQTSTDWLDQIDAAGFHGLPVDKLIELKIHGIDGNYIKEIRATGYDPSVDKLLELKIHGIDSEYIKQMRATGMQLSLDKLLEFRIHGITTEFISQQNQTGLGTLSPDKLIELKIQGVAPEFVQGIRSLGFTDLTVDKVLELKIHGITPDYIKDAKSRFKDLSLDQIIQLKIHNILN